MSLALVRRVALVIPLLCLATPLRAQEAERRSVIATVQRLFDAMATRDTAAAHAVLAPGARFYSPRGDTVRTPIPSQVDTAFLRFLASGTDRYLERIWRPEVLVRGAIAILWAPYDFHVNGERSHCGIDSFTLVRSASGWWIVNVAYTVERTGCAPSPLGPPR